MARFFHYRQNNSGGTFDGERHRIVEADTADHANAIAENVGLYWDGVELGLDCSCCGNRWRPAYGEDGTDVPSIYGEPITVETDYVIYFLDGTVKRG